MASSSPALPVTPLLRTGGLPCWPAGPPPLGLCLCCLPCRQLFPGPPHSNLSLQIWPSLHHGPFRLYFPLISLIATSHTHTCLFSVYLSRTLAPVRQGFLSCSPGCPQSTAQGQTEETLNQICKVNPGRNNGKGTQSSSSWPAPLQPVGLVLLPAGSLRPVRYRDWPVLVTERRLSLSLSKSAWSLIRGVWWGAEASGLSSLFASHPGLPPACLGQSITAGDIYRVLGWLWRRGGGSGRGNHECL